MPMINNYLASVNISSLGLCGLLGIVSTYYVGFMPETNGLLGDDCLEVILNMELD